MTDEDQFWFHAGVSEIGEQNGSRYVRIPDRLFREEDILVLGRPVNWHFNVATGVLIITHDFLQKEDYEYTEESTRFREGDSEYTCTVPKLFFKDSQGVRGTEVDPDFAQTVQLPKEGNLHFIYNRDMRDRDTKSCYVLTEKQFSRRFADSDHWDGSLEQAPMFFS